MKDLYSVKYVKVYIGNEEEVTLILCIHWPQRCACTVNTAQLDLFAGNASWGELCAHTLTKVEQQLLTPPQRYLGRGVW